ncbi:hypothetical protein JQC92_01245 [Shewanella sp. 202IG2-18]|uniref:hypothetical protein n=1 Tax=Parashewanella hymeniacidonis TaxID=2807618 RepID=UPI001961C417|nr:hypothetical protein [Parashewanella hymeniacidonis]MBM7070668.1 hypothetical protein [Parashewanella hymeniacidonis]
MNPVFVELLMSIAEKALLELSQNEELQEKVLLNVRGIADWIQEKLGKVNKHDLEIAIQLALYSAIKRDKETVCEILSVITALYAVDDVRRGAVTGGTLLQYFGDDVFPHIDKRELRFAVTINEKILAHISDSVASEFDKTIEQYQLKEYATFEGVSASGYSSAVWDTSFDKYAKSMMRHGHSVFKAVKSAINFSK